MVAVVAIVCLKESATKEFDFESHKSRCYLDANNNSIIYTR